MELFSAQIKKIIRKPQNIKKIAVNADGTTINGFNSANLKYYKYSKNQLGHRVMSNKIEKAIYERLLKSNEKRYKLRITRLDSLIKNACKNNIEMKLFFSPAHARQLVLIKESGNFESFLRWKTELANLRDFYEGKGCKISLVDFARINKITSEKLPEKADVKHDMRWYWESSHYNSELGLLVLKRLWNQPQVPSNFGIDLTSKNVKLAAAKERSEIKNYMTENPNIIAEFSQ